MEKPEIIQTAGIGGSNFSCSGCGELIVTPTDQFLFRMGTDFKLAIEEKWRNHISADNCPAIRKV